MLTVYYDSKTGNVARFISRLKEMTPCRCQKISAELEIDTPGHLITYTTKIGEVPETTWQFVQNNRPNILSITSSGNRNWGRSYGLAADKISSAFSLPVLLKFELSGLNEDINKFITKAKQLFN